MITQKTFEFLSKLGFIVERAESYRDTNSVWLCLRNGKIVLDIYLFNNAFSAIIDDGVDDYSTLNENDLLKIVLQFLMK